MIISQLRPGAVYVLPQMALVSGSSLVFSQSLDKAFSTSPFNPDVEFCQEEVVSRFRRTQDSGGIAFEFEKNPEFVAHLKKDAVPLNLIYAHNYYHFLIEWLPSLLNLLERKAIDQNAIIVSGLLHNNMWTALRYILSNADISILQLRLMQAATCDRVVMAPPSSHAAQLLAGGITDYWYNKSNILRLRERFEPLWSEPSTTPGRKLYVRRVSRVRTLTNAPEIEQLAIDAGYQIVQPERMGFLEQVRLFSSASHIMGPTGAWAANLLFVRDSAKVDIFYAAPSKAEKPLWSTLGELFGVKVNDIYGPVVRLNKQYPIHSDYAVPADACRDLLREGAEAR